MNNKTKIMLGLSALTAGTLAAGATGTLAWFTTNKTATATYSKITVQGTTGNLKVEINGLTDKNVTKTDDKVNATATGVQSSTSDVSSKDGINFYQPDWKGTQGNDQPYNKIKDVSHETGFFTQYLVTIKNDVGTATNSKLDVYLSGVEITVSGDTQNTYTKWVRVAVTSIATEDDVKKGFLKAGEGSQTYVFESDVSLDSYVSGADTVAGDKLSSKISTTWEAGVLNATGTNLSIEPTAWKNLPNEAGSFKTLGVSVWVEGTSANNQDDIKNKEISVKLTFSSKDSAIV